MAKSGIVFRVFLMNASCPTVTIVSLIAPFTLFLQVHTFWNISMSLQYQQVGWEAASTSVILDDVSFSSKVLINDSFKIIRAN